MSKGTFYDFDEFRLDVSARRLLLRGTPVPLTPRVFDTLLILVEHSPAVVDKETLFGSLWPDTFVAEGNLTQNISVLRKALGEAPDGQSYIETIPRRGYRFTGLVTRTDADQRPAAETAFSGTPPATSAVWPLEWARTHRRRFVWLVLAAGLSTGGLLLSNRLTTSDVRTSAPEFLRLTDLPGPELFPAVSPDGGSILYVSRLSGNRDIYLHRVGGRGAINLTASSPEDDTHPAYSRDGSRVAFRSERSGGGLFIMGALGDEVRKIAEFGYHPAWSPDGRELVFSSASTESPEAVYPSKLWIVEVGAGKVRPFHITDGLHPSWSPDGRWIAYWSQFNGQRDIFVTAAAGGPAIRLTDDPYLDWNPVWSPSGKHILFASDRGGSMNLWRLPIDPKRGQPAGPPEPLTAPTQYLGHISTSQQAAIVYASQVRTFNLYSRAFDPVSGRAEGEPRPVTRGLNEAVYPDLSPDGQTLVFTSWGRHEDVFTVRVDGTEIRQLTNDNYKDRDPRWSPDGRRISFQSNRGGRFEIWSVNPDGGALAQLTNAGGVTCPVPASDGSRIAYTRLAARGESRSETCDI